MMQPNHDVVEGIARHLSMYLESTRKLTTLLDQENQLMLFEEGEMQVLRDKERQDLKHALYARVETLARIVTRTLQFGTAEDVVQIRQALDPIDKFRRSLRLNSALLEVCMERQERRLKRIMQIVEEASAREVAPCR